MRFISFIALMSVTMLAGHPALANSADDLDARIEALEKENAALKKRARVEALERENAALRKQLNVVSQNEPRPLSVRTTKPDDSMNVSTARAQYVTKTPGYSRPQAEAYPETSQRWAGPYVGGHAGMGFGSWPVSELDTTSCMGCSPTYTSTSRASTTLGTIGALAGIQSGYLWQVGQFVFGPELDVSLSTIKRSKVLTSVISFTPPIFGPFTTPLQAEASMNFVSTLRGRLGFTAGNWLVFGDGGVAVAAIDIHNSMLAMNNSEYIVGYAFGGGLQYAAGPNMALRLEYLNLQFPEKGFAVQVDNSFSNPTYSVSFRPSAHVVRAGMDWNLN